jgi:hypothetical protein
MFGWSSGINRRQHALRSKAAALKVQGNPDAEEELVVPLDAERRADSACDAFDGKPDRPLVLEYHLRDVRRPQARRSTGEDVAVVVREPEMERAASGEDFARLGHEGPPNRSCRRPVIYSMRLAKGARHIAVKTTRAVC